ncbi:MAG TPA: hydantoinase/oxoprolinase family protein [Candidatus Bathyarchaeia archaeon]|nr:hydantoinase/oxoprolinase family protein [Candidatus Bathyarchaeia archaeon]
MNIILGLDIGGANTKYVLLKHQEDVSELLVAESKYFPFWKKNNEYPQLLLNLKKELESLYGTISNVVCVTTAELADCFQTKKEGIEAICSYVTQVFSEQSPMIFDVRNRFILCDEAGEHWLTVAASNWVATAAFLGKKYPNALLVDIGSTTTDLIPIFEGKVVAQGKNDLERLISRELIYSGLLRTNVIALTHEIKLNTKIIPLASELFATTGDIYYLLGVIKEEEFSVETADGKPVSKKNSLARISRIICSDLNQLSEQDVLDIVKQIQRKHLMQLSNAFNAVLNDYYNRFQLKPQIILTGSGAIPIGIPLIRMNGFYEEILTNELLDEKTHNCFGVYALIMLFAEDYLKDYQKEEE